MRGEWIEIARPFLSPRHVGRLSPCGESGLKCPPDPPHGRQVGLSPCGESGLKSTLLVLALAAIASLPMRGEWIEIGRAADRRNLLKVSPHAGRVD